MKQSLFPVAVRNDPSEFYGQCYTFGRNVSDVPGLVSLNDLIAGKKIPIPQSEFSRYSSCVIEASSSTTIDGFAMGYAAASNHVAIFGTDGSGLMKVCYSTDRGSSWTAVTTAITAPELWGDVVTDGTHLYLLVMIPTSTVARIYKFDTTAHTLTLQSSVSAGNGAALFRCGSNYYFFERVGTFPTATFGVSSDLVNWTWSSDATLQTASSLAVTNNETVVFTTQSEPFSLRLGYNGALAGPWEAKPLPWSGNNAGIYGVAGSDALIFSDSNLVSYDFGTTWLEDVSNLSLSIGYLRGAKQRGSTSLSDRYVMTGAGSSAYERVRGAVADVVETAVFCRAIDRHFAIIPFPDGNNFSTALNANTFCYAQKHNSTSKIMHVIRVAIREDVSTPVLGVYDAYYNLNSQHGHFPHFVAGPKVDPTDVVGCILRYKPDDSYKPCDGVSTYSYAHPDLKKNFPKVTYTLYSPPHLDAGYGVGYEFYGYTPHASYLNSTLVFIVAPFKSSTGHSGNLSVVYSTDNGASWTVGSSLISSPSVGNLVDAPGMSWDGTYYYVACFDFAGSSSYVYRLTTLNGAVTTTSWSTSERPVFIHSFSTTNTIVVEYTGKIFQTTNSGSTWTQIGTMSLSFVFKVVKIGSTFYVCGQGGIYSTTNFTAFTLISASSSTDTGYYGIAQNGSTWAVTRIDNGISSPFTELSTDSFASWTSLFYQDKIYSVVDTTTNYAFTIIDVVDGYFVSDTGMISHDGRFFLQPPLNRSTNGKMHIANGISGISVKSFDFNGVKMFYGNSGRPYVLAYTMTIDNTNMQIPSLFSNQYPEHGLWMKIHA